jgi:GNAT superfamily N-acetyltransferase
MASSWYFRTILNPSPELAGDVIEGLHRFNLAELGKEVVFNYHSVLVRAEAADGSLIGGVRGELAWDWLHIKDFWVAEDHRGQGVGTRLLQEIETAALSRDFAHSHLETTDFQGLGFYLKNGYEIFGELPGKPAGHRWYFLKKDLRP